MSGKMAKGLAVDARGVESPARGTRLGHCDLEDGAAAGAAANGRAATGSVVSL